ncbi:GGDEF domain-containing protein [Agaribacterium haliotis]|uniref:GGDEF domain-containing protein n=1 Tax=Agaribacterium haliotis TaxID=2013869 RepID=UPI000BB55E17|nr:GGDEF domain-containing protein [Agaribacterium haliotis]
MNNKYKQGMKSAHLIDRDTREWVILGICLAGALGVLPFTIHRFLEGDWAIALFDCFVMIAMLGLFLYVYRARRTELASLILASLLIVSQILTVAIKGPDQLIWSFPCSIGVYYLIQPQWALLSSSAAGLSIISLISNQVDGSTLGAYLVTFIVTNAFTMLFVMRNRYQTEQLEELSYKDPLTNCFNRRSFEQALQELALAPPNKEQLSIVLFELEDFERMNAQLGHLSVDEALIHLSDLVRTQLHSGERLYRISRSKFVVLPIQLALEESKQFAKRIKTLVEHSQIQQDVNFELSIGVAEREPDESPRNCLRRADKHREHSTVDFSHQNIG